MVKKKKLPIGIESFEELRKEDFYYVDKTKLIEQLLNKCGKANLFTRPRRFGKSLNMSMLRHFFEIGTDPALFEGTCRRVRLCGADSSSAQGTVLGAAAHRRAP